MKSTLEKVLEWTVRYLILTLGRRWCSSIWTERGSVPAKLKWKMCVSCCLQKWFEREVTYSSVRSVRRHLTQFKLFAKIFRAGVHCGLRFHLWDIGILIQSWMQSTGDIDRVHNPRRVPALVRAVRHKVRNNTGSECLRVDICREIVHGAIEPCVFTSFVTTGKNVLRDSVFLVVVDDLDRKKQICVSK